MTVTVFPRSVTKSTPQKEGLAAETISDKLQTTAEHTLLSKLEAPSKATLSFGTSPVTIVIPDRNEGKSLTRLLVVLAKVAETLPTGIELFVVSNGCTRCGLSESISQFRMLQRSVTDDSIKNCITDPSDSVTTYESYKFQIHHIVREKVVGKALALNLVSEISANLDRQYVINIDGDVETTPVDLRVLIDRCTNKFSEDNNPVLIGCTPVKKNVPHSFDSIMLKYSALSSSAVNTGPVIQKLVLGNMFAWDNAWLKSASGFPVVSNEDVAVSLLALRFGRKIDFCEAEFKFVPCGSVYDYFRLQVRAIRTALSIEKMWQDDPAFRSILKENYIESRTLSERFCDFCKLVVADPKKIFFRVAGFIFREIVRSNALREIQRYSGELKASWPELRSTKER